MQCITKGFILFGIVLIAWSVHVTGVYAAVILPTTSTLTPCDPETAQMTSVHRVRSESAYQGPLIDSHFHMPTPVDVGSVPTIGRDVTLAYLACVLETEGTTRAVSFFSLLDDGDDEDYLAFARKVKANYPQRFVRFLMPPGKHDRVPTQPAKKIKKWLNANRGLFQGYGEIGLYSLENRDADDYPPDADIFQKIYPLVRKHELLVYFHPGENHADNLATVLAQYPDINFMVHGEQVEKEIGDIMSQYPNVFFTVNDLYGDQYLLNNDHNKKSFLEATEDFETLLAIDLANWQALIEAHPNQFMWGTDRGGQAVWTFDVEVGQRLADYGREFIGRLDPDVQEKFAYKNAQRIIKRGY